MDFTNNTIIVSQFKIYNYDVRIVWYNKLTKTYTVTDKFGSLVNDDVPKEFDNMTELRTAYMQQYKAIEFLSLRPNDATMVSGME